MPKLKESKIKSLILVLIAYCIALAAAFIVYKILPDTMPLLLKTLIADIAATIIIFIFSVIVNNSSMYDAYWSLIPPFIFALWYMESASASLNPRLIFISIVCFLWALRLTVNWAMDWPGLTHEDWRYRNFREKFKGFYWPISFLAIHFFPTMTVFLGCIPAYLVYTNPQNPSKILDYLALLSGLLAVYYAWKGDGEMRVHRRSENASKPMASGMWSLSRHPNYFGEILFWISIYMFAIASDLSFYWSGLGALGMVLLFTLYSIPAMEQRQLARRPEYKEVMESVSILIPMRRKRR